jgi:biopolymer transport protein ExbD
VDPAGIYYIETQPVSMDALQADLARSFGENPNLVLVIRGDMKAAWEHIYKVLDKAKGLGLHNIYFRNELSQ